MEIPVELILFSLPSVIYLFINKARKRDTGSIFRNIGWVKTNRKYLLIGFALGLIPGLFSLFIAKFLPPDFLEQPGIAQMAYSGWSLSIASFILALVREAFYTALGEEILFRGFIGSLLIRRLGFAPGNILQSLIFLLPHALILTIDANLWPILIPQFIAGWLFGWLLHQSGSIIPSWVAHSLSNAFGALAFMR
jgi:membrane protease YdiL (CAAX protease family)